MVRLETVPGTYQKARLALLQASGFKTEQDNDAPKATSAELHTYIHTGESKTQPTDGYKIWLAFYSTESNRSRLMTGKSPQRRVFHQRIEEEGEFTWSRRRGGPLRRPCTRSSIPLG